MIENPSTNLSLDFWPIWFPTVNLGPFPRPIWANQRTLHERLRRRGQHGIQYWMGIYSLRRNERSAILWSCISNLFGFHQRIPYRMWCRCSSGIMTCQGIITDCGIYEKQMTFLPNIKKVSRSSNYFRKAKGGFKMVKLGGIQWFSSYHYRIF